MLTRWRSMGDVYILCGVYEGYTPGVGVLWEMYTGCWQSLGDVDRGLEVSGGRTKGI